MFRAEPRQLALEHLAPLAAVLAHVLALEPGAHLGPAARRGEEAFALDRASRGYGCGFLPPMISTTSPFARR